MRLAFMSVGESPRYALMMLASARKVMPGIEVIQLTDMETPEVDGATALRLKHIYDDLTTFRMAHLSTLEGDVICVDTDVLIQSDLRPLFAFNFDVALTWRNKQILDPNGVNITKLMPYNTGVMFQRNPRFWAKALEWCRGKDIGWYCDQVAAAELAPQFNVLKLHCDNFNYTPKSADEDVSMRHVVHYKGKSRKFLDAMQSITSH
jgi:hypothetical protein